MWEDHGSGHTCAAAGPSGDPWLLISRGSCVVELCPHPELLNQDTFGSGNGAAFQCAPISCRSQALSLFTSAEFKKLCLPPPIK